MGAELASFADQAEMDFVTSVSSVPTSFSICLLSFRQTSNKTTVKVLARHGDVCLTGVKADIPPRKTFDRPTVKSNRATGRSNNVDLWTYNKTLSDIRLKQFTIGTVTMLSGREFHRSIVRLVNK